MIGLLALLQTAEHPNSCPHSALATAVPRHRLFSGGTQMVSS